MIKAVCFDFGGVYSKRFSKEDERIELWKSIQKKVGKKFSYKIFSEVQEKLDIGKITLRQYYSELLERIGKKYTKEELENFSNPVIFKPILDKEIRKTVLQLRRNGYIVPLISNSIKVIVKLNKKKGYYKIFHPVFISCDIGLGKQKKHIFEFACKKMKIKPEDAVMIDDFSYFLKNAREIGMNTILYKNSKQLRMELKKLGVKL